MNNLDLSFDQFSHFDRLLLCKKTVFVMLSATQESCNELQRVITGCKPLPGKHFDRQHISDFPRFADVSLDHNTRSGDQSARLPLFSTVFPVVLTRHDLMAVCWETIQMVYLSSERHYDTPDHLQF